MQTLDNPFECHSVLFDVCSRSPNLMAVFDANDRLVFANDAFCEAFAVAPSEQPSWRDMMKENYLRGRGPLIDTTDIDQWLKEAEGRRGTRPYRAFEAQMIDGRHFWITETVDRHGFLFLTAFEISSLRLSGQQLREERDIARRASWTDDLTNIPNRRYVLKTIQEWLLSQDARSSSGNHALALLDLDRFKSVNDQFGHDVGDTVLVQFSQTILAGIRRNDLFGRMGGEEFLLFLPHCSLDEATQRLLTLQDDLRRIEFADAPGFRCTFSAGVIRLRTSTALDRAIAAADERLYLAKSQGRDRIVAMPRSRRSMRS